VLVVAADAESQSFAIPRPPEPVANLTPAARTAGVSLDVDRLAQIQAQTSIVTDVLHSIFSGEDPARAPVQPHEPGRPEASQPSAPSLRLESMPDSAAGATGRICDGASGRSSGADGEVVSVPSGPVESGPPQAGPPVGATRSETVEMSRAAPGERLRESGGQEGTGEEALRRVGGLDATHLALFHRVASRAEWARDEFDRLAESFGLMPGGALEILNEAAFEACGEPLLEGDDRLEINSFAFDTLMV
jgi:hypothetical protein